MAKTRKQPPGFRFHPTDVELVMFYLKRKILGKKLPDRVISELDVYKYAPWDLPDKSCLGSRDLKWYFFCPRKKKYASGARMKRDTEFGYWKVTGNERPIQNKDKVVGYIRTLVFHRGRSPKGERTDWVMHQYTLEDKDVADMGLAKDTYVLCIIFEKEGRGPRNGTQYGAPYIEEEWDEDEEVEAETHADLSQPSAALTSYEIPQHGDDILEPLDLTGNEKTEKCGNPNCEDPIAARPITDGDDIFSGLGDLGDFPGLNGNEYSWDQMLQSNDGAFIELNDLSNPLQGAAEDDKSHSVCQLY